MLGGRQPLRALCSAASFHSPAPWWFQRVTEIQGRFFPLSRRLLLPLILSVYTTNKWQCRVWVLECLKTEKWTAAASGEHAAVCRPSASSDVRVWERECVCVCVVAYRWLLLEKRSIHTPEETIYMERNIRMARKSREWDREKQRETETDKDSETKTGSQLLSYTSLRPLALAAVTATVSAINNGNGSSIRALISGNCRKAWRVIRAQRLCSFSEGETGQDFSMNHTNIPVCLTYKAIMLWGSTVHVF